MCTKVQNALILFSLFFILVSPGHSAANTVSQCFAFHWVLTQQCYWNRKFPVHLWEQRTPWLTPSYRSIAQGIPLLNTQPVLVKPQVVSASLWTKKSWLTPSYRSIAQDISFQNTPVLFLSTSEQVLRSLCIFNGYFTMVPLYTTATRTRYGEQHHSVPWFIPNCNMCKKELIIIRISASYYMPNRATLTTNVTITTM